jgi:hypothetical protein
MIEKMKLIGRNRNPMKIKNVLFKLLFLLIFIKLSYPVFASNKQHNEKNSFKSVNTTLTGTYYIDDQNGVDSNNGLSPNTAWKTLNKVNNSTFGPGAKILLKSGGVWIGQLKPMGEGSAEAPIIIDKYESGPLPLIDGNELTGQGVVRLYNQSYWEINNLEITNFSESQGDRRGVEVKASNYGTIKHIHLTNLHIHHISGISGNSLTAKLTAGIYIATVSDQIIPTRFDDILIDGCHVHHIENQGIVTNNEVKHSDYPGTDDWNKRRFTNVLIKNNIVHHISKNAMIIRLTDGGLVEHNVCYETALKTTGNTIFSRSARGTVFQYNEGFLNRSPDYDGSMYDADLNSPECVFQYSYSHDNAHGLFWMCTSQEDYNVIVRYNVSRNDKGSIFCINYANTSAYIYNNTIYIPEHLSPVIINERRDENKKYYFYNNLIYNLSPTATYQWYNANRIFSNNLFYGYHPSNEPSDPNKITSDPKLLDPTVAGQGINSVTGLKLKQDSPAYGNGMVIFNNGEKDYFGNKVSFTQKPNIGFYNLSVTSDQSLEVKQDSYIKPDSFSDWNFGNSPFAEVSDSLFVATSNAIFSFSLKDLNAADSEHFYLNLYCSYIENASGVSVYEYHDLWNEKTLSYSQSGLPGQLVAQNIIAQENSYYKWDVSKYVQARLTAGDTLVNFFIESSSLSNSKVRFNTKEAGIYPPVLEMTSENNPFLSSQGIHQNAKRLGNENFYAYQNPQNHRQLILQLKGINLKDNYNLKIIDIEGKILQNNNFYNEGENELYHTVDLISRMSSGIYILKLFTAHKNAK